MSGAGLVRVSMVGFGNVGRALARIIALRAARITERHGIHVRVVAIGDSSGVVYSEGGFSPQQLLKLVEAPRSRLTRYHDRYIPRDSLSIRELYEELKPDVHVELTPSNYYSGEPGLTHVIEAIKSGSNVVLANKAPLVLAFSDIMDAARSKGLYVRFRATVMGGTPLIDLLQSIRSASIERIQGILNATTNFILTEMHRNLSTLEEALKKAQSLGIAEKDPSIDIMGIDSAAKLVILSNLVGAPLKLDNIVVESLDVDVRRVLEAVRSGRTIKYVATLDVGSRVGSVTLREIPQNDFLARVNGTLNAVRIDTEAGPITLVGKGAGKIETAYSVLDDIIAIGEMIHGKAR